MFVRKLLFVLMLFKSHSVFSTGEYEGVPGPNNITFPPFHKLHCTDDLVINLTGTNGMPLLTTNSKTQSDNQSLNYEVIDGTLFLSIQQNENSPKKLPVPAEPMILNLKTGPLSEITAAGNCKINAIKLPNYEIQLFAEQNGQIHINGNIKVSRIIASHNSVIDVFWANSRRLYINAYELSKVKIAGIAKEIFLKAFGSSIIDAQFLRTERVYAQASDFATIAVLPLCELRAFAQDRGRVDYYTVPRTAMTITQSSGNILWMGYRN